MESENLSNEDRGASAPYPSHPDDKIPKSWLIEKITDEKIQKDKDIRSPFGFPIWWLPSDSTLEKMQSGDELWSFCKSAPLSSRAGVAIVRNGVVVHAELRMMS